MSLKIMYEAGPSLDRSYFVASDGTTNEKGELNEVVIRASQLLHPSLVDTVNKVIASEAPVEEKEKKLAELSFQPQDHAEKIEAACTDLASFKEFSYSLASKHADLRATAAGDVGKSPTFSTEPWAKIKVGAEPIVAAEEGYGSPKGIDMEAAPAVRKLLGGLPGKAVGEATIAMDFQSSAKVPAALQSQLLAQAEEIKQLQTENKGLKDEKAAGAKEKDVTEILSLLTELGGVEDNKDKEAAKKDFGALDEKALGVFEKWLKQSVDKEPKKPAGAKPPMGGGVAPAAPKKPAGMPGEPVMSSRDNIFQGSVADEHFAAPVRTSGGFAGDPQVAGLANAWIQKDNSKSLTGRTR